MIYNDPIYGQIKFSPLETKIINNPGLQRLKKIHQNGANYLVNRKLDTSRFEHSLGVAALTKFFDCSEEETVAAIIHDISHTVFSHVVDLVLERKDEGFHEDHKRTVLRRYRLDKVIKQEGYDPDYVFDEDNFSVLERDQPDICADRLDYTLRDLYKIGTINQLEINNLLHHLTVKDGLIVAEDVKTGREILKRSVELNKKVFFRPIHEISNLMLSEVLGMALDRKIIEREDLFSTDDRVLHKLRNSLLQEKLERIQPEAKENSGKSYCLYRKPRVIDPLVLLNGKKQRLSRINNRAKEKLDQFKRTTPREVYYNLNL